MPEEFVLRRVQALNRALHHGTSTAIGARREGLTAGANINNGNSDGKYNTKSQMGVEKLLVRLFCESRVLRWCVLGELGVEWPSSCIGSGRRRRLLNVVQRGATWCNVVGWLVVQ